MPPARYSGLGAQQGLSAQRAQRLGRPLQADRRGVLRRALARAGSTTCISAPLEVDRVRAPYTYLAREVACCRQPGAVDRGTHIIAVVRRT